MWSIIIGAILKPYLAHSPSSCKMENSFDMLIDNNLSSVKNDGLCRQLCCYGRRCHDAHSTFTMRSWDEMQNDVRLG